MEIGKLTVQTRGGSGKGDSRRLRVQGLVPGICYGEGVESAFSFSVHPKALKAALDPAKKQNTVIELLVEKDGKTERTLKAMLWEYQVHPLKQKLTHVDLKSIDPDKRVEIEVPIHLVGKHAGAVDGGIISWERRSLTVKCKPADIPPLLNLDITPLDIGDALHVSDIPMPEGVESVTPGKLGVATCVAPRGAETATAVEAEGEPAAADAKKPAAGADKAAKASKEAKPAKEEK